MSVEPKDFDLNCRNCHKFIRRLTTRELCLPWISEPMCEKCCNCCHDFEDGGCIECGIRLDGPEDDPNEDR
jgi:hypothetical protein